MKKYKLIKEYPGSPKLGYIVIESNNKYGNITINVIVQDPQLYPEFWEEVIEKDYEILSIFGNENIPIKKSDFINNGWNIFLNNNLNGAKIHSVKRLSDGEIFTIGDKYKSDIINEIKTIESIDLSFDKIMIRPTGYGFSELKNIIKLKKPLFTTEDGVDMFENVIVYAVRPDYTLWCPKVTYNFIGNIINDYKIFSTEKAAEEYILMNKPCLSLNDIEKAWFMSVDSGPLMKHGLKELVKSKL